uniref:Uncharacterized protein n=1 Tax=Panagrolaimus sp. JU765 TaxID=591449 RepID=A0AC34R488_9BILA
MDGITSFVSINDERLPVLKKLFGFAVLMPIVFLNLFSLRKTVGKFQVLATFLKIAIVLVIIFAGIFNWIRNGKSSTFDEPFANDKVSTGGIALGFYAGLYSYNGWQLLTVGVEEVENPKRTLPIATFSGLFLAASIYLAMNAAYFSVLTVEEFKSTETVAILFLKKALSVELSKSRLPSIQSNMARLFLVVLSLFTFLEVSLACTIEVLIKSSTHKAVYAQFTSPDGQKSPLWLFKTPTQNHRFEIKMDNCSKSPMIVDTFEFDKATGQKGKLIHSTRSFVNGNGFVDYTILDDKTAKMSGRVGVFCSFGECGGRGKREAIRADRRRFF